MHELINEFESNIPPDPQSCSAFQDVTYYRSCGLVTLSPHHIGGKRDEKGDKGKKSFAPPTPLTRTQLLTSSWFSWVSKGGCSGEANILPSGPANFWFSETTSGSHQQ